VISKKWLSAVGAGVLALGLVACGDDDGDGGDGGTDSGNEELSGTIVVDGSSTVAPLTEAASELFSEEQPGVEVTVSTAGTGGGFERFCRGETDISDASRPIDPEDETEVPACEAAGIEFAELQVANDALTVAVNIDNPVDCLTVEQLTAIWGADSTLTNWSEIPDLGVDFDEPLDLYSPGTTSGTYDYFNEVITGDAGQRSEGYTDIGEQDNTGITGIEGSLGGMFYVGFSYYLENEGRVKALQIDGGAGCVAPSLDTVLDSTYTPLSRPLFIYPKGEALERPEVQAFVQFYVENAALIAEERGFVGLTEEQQTESQSRLDGLLGG
jgi:phosphate transport system substrate-binding protein